MSTLELENIKHPDNSGDNLTLDSNGNIGIGVTPAAWWSNATAVQISPVGALYNTSNYEDLNLSNNAYYNSSGTESYIQNDAACKIRLTDAGLMDFRVAGTGTAGNAISWTTALAIDSSGRVKIGNNEATIGDQQLFISGTKTSFATLGYSLWQNQLAVHDNRVPSGGAGTEAGVGGSISFTADAGGGQKTWLGLVEGYKQNNTAGDYGGGLKMRVRQNGNPTMLTGISINSDAQVTTPKVPAWSGGLSGSQSGLITSYIVRLNNGNHFSNGVFTCPVAGNYFISFFAMTSSAGAMDIELRINGSTNNGLVPYSSSAGFHTSAGGTTVLYLNANDTIQMHNNNTQLYGNSTGRHTGFSGHLIG
jgi:hypothetical protein